MKMDRLGILRITAAKATNMHCVTGMLIGTAGDKDTVLPQWIRTRHSILAQLGAVTKDMRKPVKLS
jgi:hypothetical protein